MDILDETSALAEKKRGKGEKRGEAERGGAWSSQSVLATKTDPGLGGFCRAGQALNVTSRGKGESRSRGREAFQTAHYQLTQSLTRGDSFQLGLVFCLFSSVRQHVAVVVTVAVVIGVVVGVVVLGVVHREELPGQARAHAVFAPPGLAKG